MNYGLYLSAAGAQVNMYRQDVFANNLANQSTVGFKRDLADVRQRHPESVEDSFGFDLRKDVLDMIGGGVFADPAYINLEQGDFKRTGKELDAALEQKDAFFVVQMKDGDGKAQEMLTRDGRMMINSDRQLVMAASGLPVLDQSGAPIAAGEGGRVSLTHWGDVVQDGEVLGQLAIRQVSDATQLQKGAHNLLRMEGGDDQWTPAADRRMRVGFIESSTVDPIKTLMDLVGATKAVQMNSNMIRYADAMMDRAINTFGRVA